MALIPRFSRLFALPLAAASLATAQVAPLGPLPTFSIEHSGYLLADVLELEAAQFTEDLVVDGVLRTATDLFLVYSPDQFSSVSPIPFVSSHPPLSLGSMRLSSQSYLASLCVSTAAGVYTLNWDNGSQSFANQALALGGVWKKSSQLQGASVDGVQTLLGIRSNKLAVLTATDPGTGLVNGIDWPHSETILDFEPLDFDNDGDTDLAVLSTNFLTIYDQPGTPPLAKGPRKGALPNTLCKIWDNVGSTSPALDRLAWMAELTPGSFTVHSALAGNVDNSDPILVPVVAGGSAQALDPFGMRAGDIDGDGNADLLIHDLASHRDLVLYQQDPPGKRFRFNVLDSDHALLHLSDTPAASGAANLCQPAVLDISSTARADVFAPVNSSESLEFFVDEEDTSGSLTVNPPLGGGATITPFAVDHHTYFDNAFGSTAPEPTLLLTLDVSPALLGDYSHVLLQVWWQKDPDGTTPGAEILEDVGLESTYYSLSSMQALYTGNPSSYDPRGYIPVQHSFANSSSWSPRHRYYFRYRFVEGAFEVGTSNFAVTKSSNSIVGGFTMQIANSTDGGPNAWCTDYPLLYFRQLQVDLNSSFSLTLSPTSLGDYGDPEYDCTQSATWNGVSTVGSYFSRTRPPKTQLGRRPTPPNPSTPPPMPIVLPWD